MNVKASPWRRAERIIMVIGHFTPGLWEPGGISAYVRRLGEAQQAAGHTVLYFDLLDKDSPQARRAGTTYCTNQMDVPAAAKREGAEILHLHRDFPIGDPPAMPMIRTIHDHTPYCPSGGRYLKRPDRPCNRNYSLAGCLWGHAVDRCGSIRPKAILANFTATRHELHRLPRIKTIVSSRFVLNQMLRSGYDPDGIVQLPMPAPAPVAQVAPAPATARFLFLGRIVPHKGLAWLLRNMVDLPREIVLDVAGQGNELDAMKSLARELRLDSRVIFHGWINGETTRQLLDACTALIVPSRWHEPFGLVTLEAMARGRAVIASDTGALPEVVIDKETGLIVPATEEDGLARAMSQLSGNPVQASTMGRTGWQLVKARYQMADHLRHVIEFYQQCVAA
jgi:glycosyltransferase involved in cell wall biosynthesis